MHEDSHTEKFYIDRIHITGINDKQKTGISGSTKVIDFGYLDPLATFLACGVLLRFLLH